MMILFARSVPGRTRPRPRVPRFRAAAPVAGKVGTAQTFAPREQRYT